VGNTSLSLAVDIVRNPEYLDELQSFVNELRSHHVMFATSEIFKNAYIIELAYWTQGMPIEKYNLYLKRFGINQELSSKPSKTLKIVKVVTRDIADLGKQGLTVVPEVGTVIEVDVPGCKECKKCMLVCPGNAIISVEGGKIRINSSLCLGTTCRKCMTVCPKLSFENIRVLSYESL